MVIYIDLIVILNLFIDFIILVSVDIILKRRSSFKRIILASLLGSLSCLLLFYINDNYVLIIYKFVISILMVIISFKYESFKYFKDNLIWLYIISIILGGSIYLVSDSVSLSNKGLIFINNSLRINIYLLILIGPLVIYKYLKNIKNYHVIYSNYYDIDIYYNGFILSGIGFLDTGNNLRDPYFNKPIILVNKDLIRGNVKSFLVPYNTISGTSILKVFKPEKIIINKKKINNVLIGLSDINIDGVKIILNKEAL